LGCAPKCAMGLNYEVSGAGPNQTVFGVKRKAESGKQNGRKKAQ